MPVCLHIRSLMPQLPRPPHMRRTAHNSYIIACARVHTLSDQSQTPDSTTCNLDGGRTRLAFSPFARGPRRINKSTTCVCVCAHTNARARGRNGCWLIVDSARNRPPPAALSRLLISRSNLLPNHGATPRGLLAFVNSESASGAQHALDLVRERLLFVCVQLTAKKLLPGGDRVLDHLVHTQRL